MVECLSGEDKVACAANSEPTFGWLQELMQDLDHSTVVDSLNSNRLDDEIILPGLGRKLKVANFFIEDVDLKVIRENGTNGKSRPKNEKEGSF